MHAYHWQQSWCGGLGAGGEELQDKREDTHEVYMQNVIQRMHACLPLAAELVRGTGIGGGRSCKTIRKTLMKPQYSYMQDVIEIQVGKQSFSITHEAKYEMRTGSREVLPDFHVHEEFYTA